MQLTLAFEGLKKESKNVCFGRLCCLQRGAVSDFYVRLTSPCGVFGVWPGGFVSLQGRQRDTSQLIGSPWHCWVCDILPPC
jgi:hypothetical protein